MKSQKQILEEKEDPLEIFDQIVRHWFSMVKPLDENTILIEDEGIHTKIKVKDLFLFRIFWSLLLLGGYECFDSRDFKKFLGSKDERRFDVLKNKDNLFNLPSNKIFFLLEFKKGTFTSEEISEIYKRLLESGKEIMYQFRDTEKDRFLIYVLY